MFELNKALKRKEIDVNSYRTTHFHYKKRLDIFMKNIKKLLILAKEYYITLENKYFELEAEKKFMNAKALRKKRNEEEFEELKKGINWKQQIIKEKLFFLKKQLIN